MVPREDSKGSMNEIPNCKPRIIEDCGHIPHIEKPIEFTNIIQDFLLLHHMIFCNRKKKKKKKKKKKSSRGIVGSSDQVSDKLMLDSTIDDFIEHQSA